MPQDINAAHRHLVELDPKDAPHMTSDTAITDAKVAASSDRARAWLVLLLAGAFEIGYALAVGGSQGFTVFSWSLVAIGFFLSTLFTLSLALRTIDVGIGYAVWAGIGAVGAALFGPLLFDETLTPANTFWLSVIIAGVVWLKLSDRPERARTGPQVRDPLAAVGEEQGGRSGID